LDTVALGALGGDEGRLNVPGVAAGVGDLLGDGLDELEVLGRALEEDQRNSALGGGVPWIMLADVYADSKRLRF
jgi:hypothetical protein